MDLEQELARVADGYRGQGYDVTIRPRPEQLPAFAHAFKVELLGKLGTGGVLVAVKRNRSELEADPDLQRYAEITGTQRGWRFDFAILEGENPMGRGARDVRDYSPEEIERALAEAEHIAEMGFVRAGVVAAWAALESAMRMRLRASGEAAAWGVMPQEVMNELYSTGVLSAAEFRRLEGLAQLRNQIAHGFSSPSSEAGFLNAGVVPFLTEVARRLVRESQPVEQMV